MATTEITQKEDVIPCSLEDLTLGIYQFRRTINQESIDELAQSIKETGLVQPIIVDQNYKVISGERRYHAAERAGLTEVPVIIRTIENEEQAFILAITLNVQRKDLTPIEEAFALHKLFTEFCNENLSEVAMRIGKHPSSVQRALDLLKLPLPIRQMIEREELPKSHALAILRNIKDENEQIRWAEKATKLTLAQLQGQLRRTQKSFIKLESATTLLERLCKGAGSILSIFYKIDELSAEEIGQADAPDNLAELFQRLALKLASSTLTSGSLAPEQRIQESAKGFISCLEAIDKNPSLLLKDEVATAIAQATKKAGESLQKLRAQL